MLDNGTVTIASGAQTGATTAPARLLRTPDGWRPPPEPDVPPTAIGAARLTADDYLALNARARRERRVGHLIVVAAVVVGYLLGRWR